MALRSPARWGKGSCAERLLCQTLCSLIPHLEPPTLCFGGRAGVGSQGCVCLPSPVHCIIMLFCRPSLLPIEVVRTPPSEVLFQPLVSLLLIAISLNLPTSFLKFFFSAILLEDNEVYTFIIKCCVYTG